jgi:hypothetical protein
MRPRWMVMGSVILAGLWSAPVWGDTNPAQPGMLNYSEGLVYVNGQRLDPNARGNELQPGQALTTQDGRAEMLLTPGIFLRLNRQSAIQMDSADLANLMLTLQKGQASIEVDQIFPENNIVIREAGASTKLDKKGIYEFDANAGLIRVFDGKAEVQVGGREKDVDGGHQFTLNDQKSHGFDKKKAEGDDFYRWASLRAAYLSEANIDAAQRYPGTSAWVGPGWYYDPYYLAYTWVPGDGLFWSPFGWAFYSPFAVWGAPYVGFGYGFHHFGPGYHPVVAAGFRGGFQGGFAPGAVRGGGFARGGYAGGMHAGGMRGGGFGGGGRR